nr:MAG TPA: hypothetical protein [Caudoviricetes sp.]
MYSLVGNKDVSINPISLNEAINGTNRTDVFNEELTQFEKMNANLNSKNELESEHIDSQATRRDMSDVSKKAQLKQLLKDLEDQEHRYRIANRLWKNAPVTEVDLNDAADGDVEAEDKVDSAMDKIINDINNEQSDNSEDSDNTDGDFAAPDTLQQEDELAERYMSRNKSRDERKRKQKEKALSRKKDVDEDEDSEEDGSKDVSTSPLSILTKGFVTDDSDIDEEGDEGETIQSKSTQGKTQPENSSTESTDTKDEDDIESTIDDGDKTDSELESETETNEDDYSDEEFPDNTDYEEQDEELQYDSESQEAAAELEIEDDSDIQEAASEAEAEVLSSELDVQEAAAEAEAESFEDIEDISDVDTEDYGTTGRVKYKDKVLSKKQSKQLMDELIILGRAEIDGFDQKELPDGTVQDVERYRMNVTYETIGSFISNTFFYQPNPDLFEETGEYELMKLTVNGEQVELNKPLASGKQLSEKLSQEGWLQSTKKYYIVTQSQQSEKNTIGDVRDSMTVCLILEDDNNTYATTLRALGLMVSDIPGDPNGKYTVSQ